jgi:hypothetical protein
MQKGFRLHDAITKKELLRLYNKKMEYAHFFSEYFQTDEVGYRAMPIKGGGINPIYLEQVCFGNKPPPDDKCKAGYFCNTGTRKWNCKS